jgi:arginase family enzyme
MSRTLILDFDGSVRPLEDADTIPLQERQEAIRFGCRMATLRQLESAIEPALRTDPPVVFMGSGDYHHVSYLLIERLRRLGERIQVVVLDNHPDNMRYPFGIHCGSWVWHVSRLPFVARVHVAGITSGDVEGGHAIENHLAPLRSGRVVYWCVQRSLRALRMFGVGDSRSFPSVGEMLAALGVELAASPEPVYFSIDKDVLSHEVVQTNWDQGVMRLEELESAITMLQGRLIGSDVVGDVSSYRYRSRFKRLLSGLDGQPDIPVASLEEWQLGHQRVNQRLVALLARSRSAT